MALIYLAQWGHGQTVSVVCARSDDELWEELAAMGHERPPLLAYNGGPLHIELRPNVPYREKV